MPIKLTPMRWCAILAFIVCVLSLSLPADPHTLHSLNISQPTYRIIIAFLLIPEIVIWYASFFAYAKLKEYTHYLKGSKDGPAFTKIMTGVAVLAFGLVVPSIISLPLNTIAAHHDGFRPAAAIITNYISLLVAAIAFTYINSGSHLLMLSIKKRAGLKEIRLFMIAFILLSVFFSHAAMHTRSLDNNPYYLGHYLLMITLITPYLYAWYEGLSSAYSFWVYSRNTQGLLYKKAFVQLASGMVVVIIGFIAIQFITSTFGANTTEPLGYVLVLVNALLAVLLLGLALLAFGAKKLKKIEEV